MKKSMLCALVTLALLFGAGATWFGGADDQESQSLKAAAEEVDIMRRVLAKGLARVQNQFSSTRVRGAGNTQGRNWLSGRFYDVQSGAADAKVADGVARSLTDATDPWATVYRGNRAGSSSYDPHGYLIPGHGAFFTLDVHVRTVKVDVKKDKTTKKDAAPDLWDEAKSESEGRRTQRAGNTAQFLRSYAFENRVQKARKIDEAAVDKVIDTIVRVLASHGARMKNLGDDQQVIVSVNLRPDRVSRRGAAVDFVYLVGSGRTTAGRTAVIRTSMRNLRRLAESDATPAEARERMSITTW